MRSLYNGVILWYLQTFLSGVTRNWENEE